MIGKRISKAMAARLVPAFFIGSALALAVPTAGLALSEGSPAVSFVQTGFARFTPASVDPQLAQRVARSLAVRGEALPFTPAGAGIRKDRVVTVAVRVDDETARAISVRSAIAATAQAEPGKSRVAIAPTRYNLGIARGYQSFAKPAAAAINLEKLDMPDLAEFAPSKSAADTRPSRLQPRIALEQDAAEGRAPRPLGALGEQSVDLGGAYRITRNLDVTAGVRLSKERDRLDPLTDSAQDNQAVYLGTQFRF